MSLIMDDVVEREAEYVYMQEIINSPLLAVVTPVKGRNFFINIYIYISNKRQLSRARMNERVPWMIGMDLSGTNMNLKYENIVACKVIKEDVFEHKTTTCEIQPHLVSKCNKHDEDVEDDEKNINWETMIQIWRGKMTI